MITGIDKNTALVLIDLQKGIAKGDTAHPVKEVLAKAAQLLAAFRHAKLTVVIVNVNPVGAAWTKTRVESSSVPKNPVMQTVAKVVMPVVGYTDIVPEIQTQPDDIRITKKNWNAFYDTTLHQQLQERAITQIVLGGISTSIGVEGTARAASERGYNIALATDAMTDRIAAAHEHSIRNIFPRIGELGTVNDIISKLPR